MILDKLKQEGIVDKLVSVGPFQQFFTVGRRIGKRCGKEIIQHDYLEQKGQSYYLPSAQYELLFLCIIRQQQTKLLQIDLCDRYQILMGIDESHYIKRLRWVWSNVASLLHTCKQGVNTLRNSNAKRIHRTFGQDDFSMARENNC